LLLRYEFYRSRLKHDFEFLFREALLESGLFRQATIPPQAGTRSSLRSA
jgi:hypothetical protein